MTKITHDKFFSRYIPTALIVVGLLVCAFIYYTAQKSKLAEAGEAFKNRGTGTSWYSSSWTYRKPITIDHAKVSPTAVYSTSTVTFTSNGSWTVPAGTTTAKVKAWGGGGGGGGGTLPGSGGGGGFAQGTISVTPGESLTVYVGSAGSAGASAASSAGGGGYSAVTRSSTYLIQAGGGGGGGGGNSGGFGCGMQSYCGGAGGAGGGNSGVNGSSNSLGTNTGGGGGTSSGGGTGGSPGGSNGSANTGGTGASSSNGSGGNGGGGSFGGGGGGGGGGDAGGGGGGGGSDLVTGTNTVETAGSGTTPGNSGDAEYPAGAGSGGGASTNGNAGAVVIDYSYISSYITSFSNFPMLIFVTDPDLKYTGSGGNVASSTGADILFTDSDGTTLLNYEIESYASTTGQLVAWVKIPTLSSASDHTIYEYFGNASAPAETSGNKTGTWDTNYQGVYHLPNGTTLTANDSTSNAKNGTLVNTPTAVAGQIDGAANFVSASSQHITTALSLNSLGALTYSFWGYRSATSNTVYTGSDNASTDAQIGYYTDGKVYLDINGGGTYTVTSSKTGWFYAVMVFDGSQSATKLYFYENGASQTVSSQPTATTTGASVGNVDIGHRGIGTYTTGYIDEVRISNTARSSGWIATEYNNQSSPSTFYAYGALSINGRQNSSGTTVPAIKIRGGVKFH